MLCFFFPAVFLFGFKGILLKGILFQARFSGRTSMIGNWWLRIHIEQDEQDIMLIFFLSLTSSFPSRFVPSAGSFNLIGNLKSADPPNQNRVKSIKSTDIYIYIYMPGLCPEPQPRQATHHHHHQTLVEDLQNEDRSLTGVGELNPYWRSSMNVEV